jgi:hypothetical protein
VAALKAELMEARAKLLEEAEEGRACTFVAQLERFVQARLFIARANWKHTKLGAR